MPSYPARVPLVYFPFAGRYGGEGCRGGQIEKLENGSLVLLIL